MLRFRAETEIECRLLIPDFCAQNFAFTHSTATFNNRCVRPACITNTQYRTKLNTMAHTDARRQDRNEMKAMERQRERDREKEILKTTHTRPSHIFTDIPGTGAKNIA